MELEGEADEPGDVDVVEPAGRDHDGAAAGDADRGVGLVFEAEVEFAGEADESRPHPVGDTVSATESWRVVFVVEDVGGSNVLESGGQLVAHRVDPSLRRS